MLPVCKALECVRFVKPIFDAIPQGSIFIMSRHYTKEIYERARAVENAHFLKIQTEQLRNLRNKIERERGTMGQSGKVENSLQMNSTQNADSSPNVHKPQSVITQQADN